MKLNRREIIGAGGLLAAGLFVSPLVARSSSRFEVTKTAAEWRSQLGAARFNILRNGGTERPNTSPLDKEKRRGTYVCAGCGLPLFSSAAKFESGTGWPSFFRVMPNAVIETKDSALRFVRTEISCRRCGGHLGHVFKDGPKPTGLRYCINGLALRFRPA